MCACVLWLVSNLPVESGDGISISDTFELSLAYNLIVNLSIENQQLKEKIKDVNKSLKNVQQRNREYRNNCFELNKKICELKRGESDE